MINISYNDNFSKYWLDITIIYIYLTILINGNRYQNLLIYSSNFIFKVTLNFQ